MLDKQERHFELFDKYERNRISEKEFQEFIELLSNLDNKTLDKIAIKNWESPQSILKENLFKTKIRRSLKLSLGIAASVTIIFFFVMIRFSNDQYYKTNYAETKNIELPDGSSVLLNANTTLKWLDSSEGENKRIVELVGEAYFDVVHTLNNKEFIVNTNNAKISVLGTTFNLQDRGNGFDLFLQSGKVDLKIGEMSGNNIIVKPGNYIQFDKDSQTVIRDDSTNLRSTASWVEGILAFKNKYLYEILQEFEELYGLKFVFRNDEIKYKRLDLTLPFSDWELIKESLQLAVDVQFIQENNIVIIQ